MLGRVLTVLPFSVAYCTQFGGWPKQRSFAFMDGVPNRKPTYLDFHIPGRVKGPSFALMIFYD
jgi:hypothetical protein